MKVPDQIRAILKKGNLNQAALAKELGVSQPTVHRWIKGSEPYGDHLELIRAMYQRIHGDGPEATKGTVPLMGYVGAGAEILPEFEQIPPDGLDQIEVDFALPRDMICFRVRGESMMPQFRDGATILVYREQRRPIESFYGEEAVVRTADGRRFIKTITRSPHGVNLTSWNALPIQDQRLDWIGEIYAILPPRFSARF